MIGSIRCIFVTVMVNICHLSKLELTLGITLKFKINIDNHMKGKYCIFTYFLITVMYNNNSNRILQSRNSLYSTVI